MQCTRCTRHCLADAKFCDRCGAPLDALAAAVVADEPPDNDRFVGRQRELAVLDALLTRALAAAGGTAALAGDPGIGKTRTAERLAEHALARGMTVYWGRCNEEPGAPAYWPWQQMVQAWLAGADNDTVRRVAAREAAALAEIVPEILERVSGCEPAPPMIDAAQARFRLFDAVASFWKRAAAVAPLLLVFDNLHWADASSLRLLEFLAPSLASSRVLVLITYRDIELSRQHPLSATLGELARQPGFERLRLAGLSRAETAGVMRLAGDRALAPALVDAIHEQTEGNPLFIGEITRLLLQEALADDGVQHPATARSSRPLRIPEGIKEVIGRRLNRLSDATNRVLAAASVIGRAFELRLLARLLDDSDEQRCADAIEQALQARVVDDLREPGRYQFAHALFRETLYDEIPRPQRSRLHLRLVSVIEAIHADDLERHLPALAHHQWAALPAGDVARAVAYAERAAQRADRALAHEEAARFYQLALDAMEVGSGFSRIARCALLNALGTARSRAGEYVQAQQVFKEAAQLGMVSGSAQEQARAALGFENASWSPGGHGGAAAGLLREALASLGGAEPPLVARLLSALARALIFSGEEEQAAAVHEEAVAAARRTGDAATLAETLIASLSVRWRGERIAQRIEASEEAYRLAHSAGNRHLVLLALPWLTFDDFESGDLSRWHLHLDEYERGGAASQLPFIRYVTASSRTMHALFEGRFADAERLAQHSFEIGNRMPGLDAAGVYGMQMFTLRREQGRLLEVAPLVEHFVNSNADANVWRPGLTLMYAELGRMQAAREAFDALAAGDFKAIARDGVWLASITYMAIVCHALGDAARAASLYRMLEPYSGRNLMVGTTIACFGAADTVLGMLATTLTRGPAARRHFEAALAMNERLNARPALVRTRWHFAQLLLPDRDPAQRDRAAELLRLAHADAAALGMGSVVANIEVQRAALAAAPARLPAGLSAREAQVLRLVATGKGNRQIAAELFVSPNTVANHVRSILAKTGSANRTEAAAFAMHNALL